MSREVFRYEDKDLNTLGDLMNEIERIVKEDDRDQAQEFMREYAEFTEYAHDNIGYISGYFDRETAAKVMDLFDVTHPVFGLDTNVDPDQAFQMGMEMAKLWQEEDEWEEEDEEI